MPSRWIDRELDAEVQDIVSHAEEYHETFYETETFGGPSLHFHRRALDVGLNCWREKTELVYAALASWGMHRMGRAGSKMQPFTLFEQSMTAVRHEIEELSQCAPQELSEQNWQTLELVFKTIRVMASGTTIVGNSKVLAHFLPNLVAPVDREYTLNYLFNGKMFQNGLEREWILMRKIHAEFYYPILVVQDFQIRSKNWMRNSESFPWDSSDLKLVDNLVIGAMRTRKDAN
ncbi:MAG TPA: hypothetical protein PKY01_14985 [Candidatus Hydrogenedentes bacterium]|nr:hypothetical protein [Candidatus Hydrogenedentota bacterium]